MIQIKKNDYVQPTEVREEVVQAICEAFLGPNGDASVEPGFWRMLRTQGINADQAATIYVAVHNKRRDYSGFATEEKKRETLHYHSNDYTFYRMRSVEVRQAFEELVKAGYYMFGLNYYTQGQYWCYQKPKCKGYESNITEFKANID